MRLYVSLCMILFILSSCSESSNRETDLQYCNSYYKKYLAQLNQPKRSFAILYANEGCFSCDQGYFDRLVERIIKFDVQIYSTERNLDSIQSHCTLSAKNYQSLPDSFKLNKQYFMRHILVAVKIDTLRDKVVAFTPITATNVDTISFGLDN